MNDIISKIISEHSEKINNHKNEVLKSRIESVTGEVIDIITEHRRRFKRFVCEVDHLGTERYYFNDGTLDGILLMTFKINSVFGWNFHDNSAEKITYEIK